MRKWSKRIYNIKIEYTGDKNRIDSSLFVLDDVEKNAFENINVNGTSELKDTVVFIKNYNDSTINNVIYITDDLEFINNFEIKVSDNIFKYHIKDGKLMFYDNYAIKSIMELFNNNSSLTWGLKNNTFRMENNGKDDTPPKRLAKSRRSAPSAHASGVANGVVYINDYEADWNYYQGLNYIYSSNNTIPSTLNYLYVNRDGMKIVPEIMIPLIVVEK